MSKHRNTDFLLDFGYAMIAGDVEWHEEEWILNKNDRIHKNYKMWHRRPRVPSCCMDLEKQLTPEEILIMKEDDEEFREMVEEEEVLLRKSRRIYRL